jgi:hypothetical protein
MTQVSEAPTRCCDAARRAYKKKSRALCVRLRGPRSCNCNHRQDWRSVGDSKVKHRRPVSASRLQLLGRATIVMSVPVRAASEVWARSRVGPRLMLDGCGGVSE